MNLEREKGASTTEANHSESFDEYRMQQKPAPGHANQQTWHAAMKRLKTVPLVGSTYSVQYGDCLESIARRQLLGQHAKSEPKATAAGVRALIDLNKDHYKSLADNPDHIRQGWKLRLQKDDPPQPEAPVAAVKPTDHPALPVVKDDSVKIPAVVKATAPYLENNNQRHHEAKKENTPVHQRPFDLFQSVGNVYDSALKEIHGHPKLFGAAALVGTAALAFAGRGKLAKLFSSEKEIASTSMSLEREAVLAKVGPIPDVVRPEIATLATPEIPEKFATAAVDYRSSLDHLSALPTHYRLKASETFHDLAQRVLNERAPITGERIFPDVVDKEAERIAALNPDRVAGSRKQVLVHDEPSLRKLAETTQFKHVPQIGQFLKQFGVTEDHVQDAFRIQNALPKENRPLIGQILVEHKLATKEQVDQAFAQQNHLKDILKEVRQETQALFTKK